MKQLLEYLISKENKKKIQRIDVKSVADQVVDLMDKYWEGSFISFDSSFKNKHELKVSASIREWDKKWGDAFPKTLMRYFDDIWRDYNHGVDYRTINIDDIVKWFFDQGEHDPENISDEINSWLDYGISI